MRIGVISDTHDRLPTFRTALGMLVKERIDVLLHAGDYVAPFAAKLIAPDVCPVPVHCIYGNNDGERAGLKGVLPQIVDGPLTVELGERNIVMHHFIDWLKPEDIADAEVVISGHNHTVSEERRDGKLFLNPGECCGWLTGRCTVAVLETDDLSVRILDVPQGTG